MVATTEEKARGAFFTAPAIADYMTEWAIRRPADRVLEPSCGEAVFLSSAASRLGALEGSGIIKPDQLHGIDLHADSILQAKTLLQDQGFSARLTKSDFFEFVPEHQYDVIVGNPPFIRYQGFSGAVRARSMEAALAQGVRLSGLSSSWAAFVVKSAQHLAPGGRLALVVPAGLLSVGYASEVRRFLLRRFSKIKLIAFEERVFPGVLEDVVLLLAEGDGNASHFELHQTKNAGTLGKGGENWQQYAPAAEGAKWTPAFVAATAFDAYETISQRACEELASWGRTYLGCVTGNNKFFTLSENGVARNGLKNADLIKISPPGTKHLRGLVFGEASWTRCAKEGAPVYLFYPSNESSAAAMLYAESGERAGVADAYKCRVRSPWWRVPLVETPDLFLTYMNHDRPRFITNESRARILNSLYGIKLKADRRTLGMDLLPIACLNSVTLLGAEVVGRSYGGGLLKLEPREADRLPVPSLATICERESDLRSVLPQLGQVLRSNDVDRAARIIDPIIFPKADAVTLDALRTARDVLFQRRQARARNGTN